MTNDAFADALLRLEEGQQRLEGKVDRLELYQRAIMTKLLSPAEMTEVDTQMPVTTTDLPTEEELAIIDADLTDTTFGSDLPRAD